MELISISTIQISRAGGWDPTVMVQTYLLGLPLKFMRCVAGFPKEPGQYHLPRAAIEPPEVLLREIYPFVEEWRRRFRARTTRKKSWAQGGLDDDDQAGLAFLALLKRLRVIVLQDLAILQPDYPGLPFFSLPLFQRQEWVDFAAVVRAAHRGNEVPRSVLLERAVPELNAAICTGFQAQERRTQAQDQAQEQRFQALEQRLERDAAQREREDAERGREAAERGREAAERGREAKAVAAQLNEIGRQLRELRDAQRRVPPELFLAHTGPDGLPRFTTYPQVRPSSLVTYSQSTSNNAWRSPSNHRAPRLAILPFFPRVTGASTPRLLVPRRRPTTTGPGTPRPSPRPSPCQPPCPLPRPLPRPLPCPPPRPSPRPPPRLPSRMLVCRP
jgi:Centromere DNA-binding protein complex CBF3 subunit, domain 2